MLVKLASCLTVVAVLAAGSAATARAAAPVRVTFDKHAVAQGVWEGTVAGAANGSLTSQLVSLEITGSIWHITVDWIVVDGERSFTARTSGTLNTTTGRVVTSGRIVNGWLDGARVQQRGRLVDAAAGQFKGAFRIAPASAG